MKWCSKCKEVKELSEFSKHKRNKDGLQRHCKKCVKIYNTKYYKDNKKSICNSNNEYYHNNIEKCKYFQKSYRINNRDEVLKQKRLYRLNNKDKIKKHEKQNASYVIYKNQLTIDEDTKLSKDGTSLEVKCRYCGKYFIPQNRQVRNRIGSLNGYYTGDKNLYCSNGCKQSCPIYNQRVWPKGFKKATSREVQPQLRQMVLKRDNYTCQKCGSEEILHCHHILPLNESPIESADVDNCITLCKSCHKLTHKIPGCGLYELRCNI